MRRTEAHGPTARIRPSENATAPSVERLERGLVQERIARSMRDLSPDDVVIVESHVRRVATGPPSGLWLRTRS